MRRRGKTNGELSRAERRSVRRAVTRGHAVGDPRLRPYARQRLREADAFLQKVRSRIAAVRQSRFRGIPFLLFYGFLV